MPSSKETSILLCNKAENVAAAATFAEQGWPSMPTYMQARSTQTTDSLHTLQRPLRML
jgi:hypothetical protein